jgi:hypothetical protein
MSGVSDNKSAAYQLGYSDGAVAERAAWVKLYTEDMEKVQKKDYELIAQALKVTRPYAGGNQKHTVAYRQWIRTVNALITELQQDNPQFNQWIFLKECGAISTEQMNKFAKLAGVLK